MAASRASRGSCSSPATTIRMSHWRSSRNWDTGTGRRTRRDGRRGPWIITCRRNLAEGRSISSTMYGETSSGDAETAVRLETSVDERHLRREDGRLSLELDRNWRIGATAMRLISLAESRGFRFADVTEIWYTARVGLEDVRGAGGMKGPRRSGSNY